MKLMPYLSSFRPKFGPGFPWALIEAHAAQSIRNHGQTLEKIASRGGFSPSEALAVIEDRSWAFVDEAYAADQINRLAAAKPAEPAEEQGS